MGKTRYGEEYVLLNYKCTNCGYEFKSVERIGGPSPQVCPNCGYDEKPPAVVVDMRPTA